MNDKLSKQVFDKYMDELQGYFSKELSEFIREIYWSRLKDYLDDSQMMQAAANAICKSSASNRFFPSAEQLAEIGRAKPLENTAAYGDAIAALPSEQMRMSADQRTANVRRLKQMCQSAHIGDIPMKKPATGYQEIAKHFTKKWRQEGLLDDSPEVINGRSYQPEEMEF